MSFEFATANRILFGPGTAAEVGPAAAGLGRHAFMLTSDDPSRADPVLASLRAAGLAVTLFPVTAEPTTSLVQAATAAAASASCDCIVGVGGGSVIDAGKAVAALLTNGGEPLDYLEVIGRGQPLSRPSAPCIAVPTTAGTGAEVTRNAVLASPEHRQKVSLRSPTMLPVLAVVDPELTYSLPPAVTASTGLDALTQVMEPYVALQANPMTDALCREGIARAARGLRRAYQDGQDAAAREDMALASLFGGLALANARLGAVHGFAGVIGGMFPAPHGVICAQLLPFVMATNVAALRARAPYSPALAKYDEIARLVTGDAAARAADGVAWVQALCTDLAVPRLGSYGVTPADFAGIVAKSQSASSMKGNPIALTVEELVAILEEAV